MPSIANSTIFEVLGMREDLVRCVMRPVAIVQGRCAGRVASADCDDMPEHGSTEAHSVKSKGEQATSNGRGPLIAVESSK